MDDLLQLMGTNPPASDGDGTGGTGGSTPRGAGRSNKYPRSDRSDAVAPTATATAAATHHAPHHRRRPLVSPDNDHEVSSDDAEGDEDGSTCPYSRLRLCTPRALSATSLTNLLSSHEFLHPSVLATSSDSAIDSARLCGGVATVALVTDASGTRLSKGGSGNAYAVLTLGTLSGGRPGGGGMDVVPLMSLFLFGDAYTAHNVPTIRRGSVVAVLDPTPLPPSPANGGGGGGGKTLKSFKVLDADRVRLVGTSADHAAALGRQRQQTKKGRAGGGGDNTKSTNVAAIQRRRLEGATLGGVLQERARMAAAASVMSRGGAHMHMVKGVAAAPGAFPGGTTTHNPYNGHRNLLDRPPPTLAGATGGGLGSVRRPMGRTATAALLLGGGSSAPPRGSIGAPPGPRGGGGDPLRSLLGGGREQLQSSSRKREPRRQQRNPTQRTECGGGAAGGKRPRQVQEQPNPSQRKPKLKQRPLYRDESGFDGSVQVPKPSSSLFGGAAMAALQTKSLLSEDDPAEREHRKRSLLERQREVADRLASKGRPQRQDDATTSVTLALQKQRRHRQILGGRAVVGNAGGRGGRGGAVTAPRNPRHGATPHDPRPRPRQAASKRARTGDDDDPLALLFGGVSGGGGGGDDSSSSAAAGLDVEAVLNAKSRFADHVDATEYAKSRQALLELERREEYDDFRKNGKRKNGKNVAAAAVPSQQIVMEYRCQTCGYASVRKPVACIIARHAVKKERKIERQLGGADPGTRRSRLSLEKGSKPGGAGVLDGGLTLGKGLEWDGWTPR